MTHPGISIKRYDPGSKQNYGYNNGCLTKTE